MTHLELRDLQALLTQSQARLVDLAQAIDRGQRDRVTEAADVLWPSLAQVADEIDDVLPSLKKLAKPRRARA